MYSTCVFRGSSRIGRPGMGLHATWHKCLCADLVQRTFERIPCIFFVLEDQLDMFGSRRLDSNNVWEYSRTERGVLRITSDSGAQKRYANLDKLVKSQERCCTWLLLSRIAFFNTQILLINLRGGSSLDTDQFVSACKIV